MCPAFTCTSPADSGTSRWITPGGSASPFEYAANADSSASTHAGRSIAARTSAPRSTRTGVMEAKRIRGGSGGRLTTGRAAGDARGGTESVRCPDVAGVDLFEMERYQSLYWHLVDHDLSESGVGPLS